MENNAPNSNAITHFLKHLFGKNLDVLSLEDSKKVRKIVNSMQETLLSEINELAKTNADEARELARSIKELTGFEFSSIATKTGGQMYVVSRAQKPMGGVITKRSDPASALVGDEFVSKNGVLAWLLSWEL